MLSCVCVWYDDVCYVMSDGLLQPVVFLPSSVPYFFSIFRGDRAEAGQETDSTHEQTKKNIYIENVGYKLPWAI